MEIYYRTSILALVLAIAVIFLNCTILLFYDESVQYDNSKSLLLVGVMSSQNHFEKRQAIRETWGQLVVNKSIELKFLIGEDICPVPTRDRVTPFGCELWLLNQPTGSKEFSTIGRRMRVNNCDIGFTFIVKTPIIIDKLGLDVNIFFGHISEKARVILTDTKTGKKKSSATFLNDSSMDFKWKSVQPILLEENFEGELKLVGENLNYSRCHRSLDYVAPVQIFETLKPNGKYVTFRAGQWRNILVGMNYSLSGIEGLEEILLERVERYNQWKMETKKLKKQLIEEQYTFQDLVFLKGFTDVYDNLSFKLSYFLKWVQKEDHWHYILKTDDDVFIDLRAVEMGLNNGQNWDLWSCLRTEIPNHSGKWRDRISESYPLFPSGSGYVLSREAVRMLNVTPRAGLGEDVAVGLSMNDRFIVRSNLRGCSWACGPRRTTSSTCNVPEVSRKYMSQLWTLYQQIGRIP